MEMSVNLNDDLSKSKSTVPKICRKNFQIQIFFERIKNYSKPILNLGKYSLDWASVAVPKGAGVCLNKVVAYFNGPTKKCCDGWKMSEPKYPRRMNDSSPITLDLCGNDSRLVNVEFTMNGRG